MIQRFKKFSQYGEFIAGYIPVDKEGPSLEYLSELLEPHLKDWQNINRKFLLARVKGASERNEFALGMEKVWKEVFSNQNGRLLINKDYLYKPGLWEIQAIKHGFSESYNRFSCIKNPVDSMIVRVLESGGNIEFVPGGFLKNDHQIAFLKDF